MDDASSYKEYAAQLVGPIQGPEEANETMETSADNQNVISEPSNEMTDSNKLSEESPILQPGQEPEVSNMVPDNNATVSSDDNTDQMTKITANVGTLDPVLKEGEPCGVDSNRLDENNASLIEESVTGNNQDVEMEANSEDSDDDCGPSMDMMTT